MSIRTGHLIGHLLDAARACAIGTAVLGLVKLVGA
jgi:hypothetical protein